MENQPAQVMGETPFQSAFKLQIAKNSLRKAKLAVTKPELLIYKLLTLLVHACDAAKDAEQCSSIKITTMFFFIFYHEVRLIKK
ncbi:hypothetical protein C1H71_17910 [Iodobacter fluviatilis]|uniref:Uncharacterized protein n=1 Tax=Iodobacter fluviatilis TaxID=537 RepID=A0A7G3GE74_9NEIS|nr:hypothetical protein C1H71_17910 [Iodobacter fluviatilis]